MHAHAALESLFFVLYYGLETDLGVLTALPLRISVSLHHHGYLIGPSLVPIQVRHSHIMLHT